MAQKKNQNLDDLKNQEQTQNLDDVATSQDSTENPDVATSQDSTENLLFAEVEKKSTCEDRKLCNGCKFFLYSGGKAECKNGQKLLKVVFNTRQIFICKDKMCEV